MAQEFKELFKNTGPETDSLDKLSTEQLWCIVKLCKYVRLRARNNTAFNNLFNQVFPYAKFTQVTKSRSDGTTYPGLSINGKDDLTSQDGEE